MHNIKVPESRPNVNRIFSKKPKKSSILNPKHDLIFSQNRNFDDLHAEWWRLRSQEQSVQNYGRYAIAMRRTKILESFPRYEIPATLDRLNRPLETIYDIFGGN